MRNLQKAVNLPTIEQLSASGLFMSVIAGAGLVSSSTAKGSFPEYLSLPLNGWLIEEKPVHPFQIVSWESNTSRVNWKQWRKGMVEKLPVPLLRQPAVRSFAAHDGTRRARCRQL